MKFVPSLLGFSLVILSLPVSAMDLEELAAVYNNYQSQLESYRVYYTTTRQTSSPEGEDQGTYVKRYEHYGKDGLFGERMYMVIPDQEEKLHSWSAYDGQRLRRIFYGGDGKPSMGFIEALDFQTAYERNCGSALAQIGLQSGRMKDDQGRFVRGSEMTDVLSLLADPGAEILPELEVLDGHPCHVVRLGNYFKAWFAKDLGCSLLRRESYIVQPDGEPIIAYRVVCEDHTEVKPGLFIPLRITQDVGKATAKRLGSYNIIIYAIDNIEFNPPLSDEDFVIDFPDGLLIEHTATGIRFFAGKAFSRKVIVVVAIAVVGVLAPVVALVLLATACVKRRRSGKETCEG